MYAGGVNSSATQESLSIEPKTPNSKTLKILVGKTQICGGWA